MTMEKKSPAGIIEMDMTAPDADETLKLITETFERVGTIERTVKLPRGFQVTLEFSGANGLRTMWKPSKPTFKSKDAERRFWKKYCIERNAFCQDMADALGAFLTVKGRDGVTHFSPTQNATKH